MSEAPEGAVPETPEAPPEQQFDTSTPEGFADKARARMAEVFGVEGGEEQPEPEPDSVFDLTDDAPEEDPGVWYDDQGRAHGVDGKFVAAPDEEEPEADPALEAVQDKYGTPEEAWKAAQHAQQLIDQQREEVGRARQEVAELRAQMAQFQQSVSGRLDLSPDELEDMLDTNPRGAAHAAARQGDADTMERALVQWAAEGPEESYEAATFRNRIENEWRAYQAQQAALPEPQAEQYSEQPTAGITEADAPEIAKVIERHPDIESYIEPMRATMDRYPVLTAALNYGMPEQKAQALEALYSLTKGTHAAAVTAQADKEALARNAERAQEARAAAAVVSASQSSQSTGRPTFDEQIRSRFREAAMASGNMRRPAS